MRKPFIPILIFLIVFSSCQAQDATLSLKLEQGKEYRQIAASKVNVIQELNGQQINMGFTNKSNTVFLVKSVSGDSYKMDVTFGSLTMIMQTPKGTKEFSSDKDDENDVISMIFREMMGKPFAMTMSRTGKVLSIENLDLLWETAVDQSQRLSEVHKEQLKSQMKKAFGEEALKGNFEILTAIYPDKPVHKGDKWTIDTKIEAGMSALRTTEYELVDVASDVALIKGKSVIKTADKDAYFEANGMPLKYDIAGSMVSEIKVDGNTGWIKEARINQEMKGDAYIKENPKLPNGMKIPMTMTNETVIVNEMQKNQ